MSQPQQPAVDGANEADHDAAEDALSVLIVALLIAWLVPGPFSLLGDTARIRRSQVLTALGATVRSFMQRTSYDLTDAAGQPGSPRGLRAAEDAYQQVLDTAADWVEQSYQRLADEARLTGDETDVYARTDGQTELRGLVQQAADNDGRAIASYAKSEARDRTAEGLGALWSEWVSRHDDRVRPSHRDLDGSRVPFGGRFVVGDGTAYLRYPGDPEGPPSETMGCRCHLRYRFRPKETSFAE